MASDSDSNDGSSAVPVETPRRRFRPLRGVTPTGVTGTPWKAPVSLAKWMTRPTAAPHDVREAVAEIRDTATGALAVVAATTGLPAASAPILVVDRNGMVDAFAHVFNSIATGSGVVTDESAFSWGTTVLVAPMLAFVSYDVLGMYDPWSSAPRLLLSAPNILRAAAAIGDGRRFATDLVCLHEQTHRVQDVAAPWLSGHLCRLAYTALHRCGNGCEDTQACARRRAGAISQATAVMSVLEGHAQMVSEDLMRSRYDEFAAMRRAMRASGTPLSRCVSRAIFAVPPLRSKMEQYRAGEEFCRAVVENAGADVLNLVWSSPEMMPTAKELAAPKLWLARI